MCDDMVKQRCPLSPTLFGLYIDDFETYLDKRNGDSSHFFNTWVAILLYVDDVDLLPKLRSGLQSFNPKVLIPMGYLNLVLG